jgi:formylglycine-generating enzyme required for sulfatase activity
MTDDLNPRDEDYPKLMNIRRKLDFLKGFIDPEDLVLFSFSGHGIANSKGEGYLVAADSYRQNFQGSSLKVKEIIQWLKEVKVKKSLLLLDACREQFIEGKAMNFNRLKAERFLQAEVGAVFYATKSGWFSYEDKDGDFGVFTRYVINGLKGEADSDKISGNEDGIITFSELASYVEERISNWALNEGKRQRPYTKILGEKFGDLALSAYVKTGFEEKKEDKIVEDKPADVKTVESITGSQAYKNNKGYWEIDHGDGIVMVYIPAGGFTMGSNDGENDEKPPHKVYLDGYWMGKYEVTFDQYDKYCEETKQSKPGDGGWGRGKRPVICVSWYDVNSYCDWLYRKTDLKFKLPTEAQWEKAARGNDRRKYPWGNRGPGKNSANFGFNIGKTSHAGSFPQGASPYGLLDIAGNVWEWCYDWDGSYNAEFQKNPKGPKSGSYRVGRGGGWYYGANFLRCANRFNEDPSSRDFYLGLRLCQDEVFRVSCPAPFFQSFNVIICIFFTHFVDKISEKKYKSN